MQLVKRSKSPYWIARGTINGRRIERSTRCSNKNDARQCLTFIIREETADNIGAEGLTFSNAAALYLDTNRASEPPLYMAKITAHFGDIPVSKIDQQAMRIAGNRLFPTAADATIRRHLFTPVKAIINNAAEEGKCAKTTFKSPKDSEPRKYFFTPEQVELLIPVLTARTHPMLRAMVTMMIGQGMRSSEIYGLEVSDVSLSNRYAMIRDPKNGQERSITLIPRVIAALSTLPTINGSGRLFRRLDGSEYPTRKECLHGGLIKRQFASAVLAIGLDPKKYKPHSCRHTWATWFYAQTKNPLLLKIEGGWESNKWEAYTKLGNPTLGQNAADHGWVFKEEAKQENRRFG